MLEYVNFEKGSANPVKRVTKTSSAVEEDKASVIQVHPNIEFQTLSGVGGAFNEIGGEALLSLPENKQVELLKNLFSCDLSGLVFNRTPVGASDFALDAYSYSPEPEDYDMKHFSIERDKKYLLPFIRKAMGVNPRMQLQASPWSPPGWMKRSGRMDRNNECERSDATLRKEPRIYKAYADYLLKYIQAYSREGIEIKKLFIQNEPDFYQFFPGCSMTMNEMHHFNTKYLCPAFKSAGIKTEIWAGTIRAISGRFDHLDLLENDRIRDFQGMGVQYFSTQYLKEIHAIIPSLRLIHTEGICYNGDNSKEQAKKRLPEIASYINSGCENYCYWNFILNEDSSSSWGWKQNSLVTINRASGEVIYNPDYNVLQLIGQTLKPGDIRIAHAADRGILNSVITVKSSDGKVKILVQNNASESKAFTVRLNGTESIFHLPPESLCRIIL